MTMMTRIVKAKGGTGPLLGLSGEATLRTPVGAGGSRTSGPAI